MYQYKGIFSIAKRAYKREGLGYILRSGIKIASNIPKDYFWLWYYKKFKSSETFEFSGTSYNYYYHQYGTTWKNERSVEIPIIWNIVSNSQSKKILEVGNVLSYRFPVHHDVLDKYDRKKDIFNEDVVEFNPNTRYDLIVSISTLEHVGWDEQPKDYTKIVRALDNLERLLAYEGRLVVTLPLGQNPEMDRMLADGKLKFNKQYFLKRVSKDRWQEAPWEEVRSIEYNHKVPTANAILIGMISKMDKS